MAAVLDSLRHLLFAGAGRKPIPALDGAYSPNSALESLPELAAGIPDADDVCVFGDGLLVASRNQLQQLKAGESVTSTFAEFKQNITALASLNDGRIAVALEDGSLRILDAAGNPQATLDNAQFNLACVTALCEHPDGGIYLTVGSSRHSASDWVWDLMQGNEHGELWRWDPASGKAERLLQSLAWPNGLCFEPDGRSVLFTQAWNHSLTRLQLGGGTPGERLQTVVGNMPGYPARITPAADGGYWLALFAMRTQLVEMVLRDKPFKKEMMRCVQPEYWVRPALRTTGSHLEPLQGGGIKKLGIKKPWAPPRSYGLVLPLNADGEPQTSMHSRVDGMRHGITAAREIHGQLVIVSKGSDALLRMDLEEAKHGG